MAATVTRQLCSCGLCRSRITAGTVARAVSPLTSSHTSASLSSLFLCPRRFFWNPFASGVTGSASVTRDAVEQQNAEQHRRMVEKAHHDAHLENEQLLGACLDLLEVCSGNAVGSTPSGTLDALARDRICILVKIILHDRYCSPAEQFDRVYAALCLPAAQERRQVQRCLMVVLRSVVPETLYRVFESVNLLVLHDDARSLRQREVLMQFMHAQLGELRVPDGLTEEEVLSVYVEDMKSMFPALATCPAWDVVELDATTIALKAKLFALLSRLCAEFDKDKTGKVKLADLRSTAERALGKDQSSYLLQGAQADKDGKIAYAQLAALLTRPPRRRSVTAESE
ncbi:hypothetical protein GH5_04869 [Leishmania sp. Ghana 2012 LV757]|uniref:hypothetical protein n=1 Tax=Leishmania sp. Ghana 2012 LV757 TaxID=2803181 RepID=UPI001B6CF137|nr:hypothetical protein GH5_04869 [Leishmania sp. Ghana 2012 LV757]